MAEIKVKEPSYAELVEKLKNVELTDRERRQLMAAKPAAYQRDVREPKLAERRKAKEVARRPWLPRQPEAIQKAFAEKGHA